MSAPVSDLTKVTLHQHCTMKKNRDTSPHFPLYNHTKVREFKANIDMTSFTCL